MPSFETLLKEKNARLHSIPLKLQTVIEKQQQQVLDEIIAKLQTLTTVGGNLKINAANLKEIAKISDELKSIFLNEDYLKAVKQFAKEFSEQATINDVLIKKGFGAIESPVASKLYIELAKKNAIEALIGSPIDTEFIKPIQSLLEISVSNGASFKETMNGIRSFVEGSDGKESKIMRYAKQITNDSFAISDASYTRIVSDALDAEWFYYSGTEVDKTRCFCKERVGNYFHYLEVESWGEGKNLNLNNSDCTTDIGGGKWAGMIEGTNSSTIWSYRGGWQCGHYFMPVSIEIVPESDIQRARNLGYID